MKYIVVLSVCLFLLASLISMAIIVEANTEAPQVQWVQTFNDRPTGGIRSMTQTSDGGYALAGTIMYLGDPARHTSDMWLIKTDNAGNVQWNRSYINTQNAYSVIQTSDGGYALTGSGRLIKTDSFGNIEWTQTYQDQTIALVQTSDGGYAIAGDERVGLADMVFWLVKTDAFGNVEWDQRYTGQAGGMAWSLVQTSDDGYILAGESKNGGYLVKVDALGKLQWDRIYGGMLYSVIQTVDDDYVVAGNVKTSSGSNNNLWIAKVDSAGKILWNQTYNQVEETDPGWWGAWTVIQTNDNGYALAGSSGLIKTDHEGNMQWSQTINGTAYSLVQLSDGGYALAGGEAGVFFKGGWLMKTYPANAATDANYVVMAALILSIVAITGMVVLRIRLKAALK